MLKVFNIMLLNKHSILFSELLFNFKGLRSKVTKIKFRLKSAFKAAYSVTMNIFRFSLFSLYTICKSRIKLCFHNKNLQYS